MRSESAYTEAPEMLAAFAPEYKKEHYHLHGRNIENWESFKSIFLDEHYMVNAFARKVIKGAIVGLAMGYITRNFIWRGPKSIELDRLYLLNKGNPIMKSYRGYTAFGAVMGATWWLIRDVICVPHGQDTHFRQNLSYGLMGGVLMATIYHPVNFIYGVAAGMLFGGVITSAYMPSLPRNFQLKMKNANQQKRARLLREDEEFELSSRNAISTRTDLYPL